MAPPKSFYLTLHRLFVKLNRSSQLTMRHPQKHRPSSHSHCTWATNSSSKWRPGGKLAARGPFRGTLFPA